MRYFDYDWELDKSGITLDSELDTGKLGWKTGDYFKLVTVNGQTRLVKVDPVVIFTEGYDNE